MNKRFINFLFVVVFCVLVCASHTRAELIYGMTAANSGSASGGLNLVRFDSASPNTITNVGAFTGLSAGHLLRSIDFRPANGQLYAMSTNSAALATAQLYTVNLTTAALTPVGGPITLGTNANVRLEMDFNPVADRIRVVTGGDRGTTNNFRVNPNDGTLVATDTSLSWTVGDVNDGFAVSIIGGAYSNNRNGATTTTLYAWDYNSDSLVTIGSVNGVPNSPNSGIMSSIDSPAVALTANAGLGMDISARTGILYVTHDDPATGTSMNLYTRNTTTGAETLIGAYPAGTFVSDISVTPGPLAADVEVSGTVFAYENRGLRGATVTLTDRSGVTRTVVTGARGTFRFDNVETDQTYILSVSSQRFTYASRVIELTDNASGLDFYAEQ